MAASPDLPGYQREGIFVPHHAKILLGFRLSNLERISGALSRCASLQRAPRINQYVQSCLRFRFQSVVINADHYQVQREKLMRRKSKLMMAGGKGECNMQGCRSSSWLATSILLGVLAACLSCKQGPAPTAGPPTPSGPAPTATIAKTNLAGVPDPQIAAGIQLVAAADTGDINFYNKSDLSPATALTPPTATSTIFSAAQQLTLNQALQSTYCDPSNPGKPSVRDSTGKVTWASTCVQDVGYDTRPFSTQSASAFGWWLPFAVMCGPAPLTRAAPGASSVVTPDNSISPIPINPVSRIATTGSPTRRTATSGSRSPNPAKTSRKAFTPTSRTWTNTRIGRSLPCMTTA